MNLKIMLELYTLQKISLSNLNNGISWFLPNKSLIHPSIIAELWMFLKRLIDCQSSSVTRINL